MAVGLVVLQQLRSLDKLKHGCLQAHDVQRPRMNDLTMQEPAGKYLGETDSAIYGLQSGGLLFEGKFDPTLTRVPIRGGGAQFIQTTEAANSFRGLINAPRARLS